MAIITLSEMTNKYWPLKQSVLLCLSGSVLVSAGAYADDLNVTGQVSSDAVQQEIQSDSTGRRQMTTLTLKPRVSATYQSRTFNGTWVATHTHIERDTDVIGRTDNFTEYQYSARWAPLDRLLSFQASGATRFRNTNAGNYLVSDLLSTNTELSKTRSNRLASVVNLPNGDWVRATGSATYSIVESESNPNLNTVGLNSESYSTNGQLQNGDESKWVLWKLSGSYQQTKRPNNTRSGDFISRNANAYVDFMLLDNWGIRLTSTHEANQISSRTDTFSNTREFNTYGAGLTFRKSDNRYISITQNASDSDVSEDQSNSFTAIDLSWAFTNRTSIEASYGRRFYGESGDLRFRYNTKHFRTNVTHSEQVTNTARLISDPTNLGIFVCPLGDFSIADCFQPSSLTYTPGSNEQLVQLAGENFELDDNIILRKSTSAQLGYSFSRLKLGTQWRYSTADYLDQNRIRRTYSIGIDSTYKLGSYTTLEGSVTYANIEQRSIDRGDGVTENWNTKLSLRREVGQSLVITSSLTYIQKSGNLNTSVYGQDYKDRRISIGLVYNYD